MEFSPELRSLITIVEMCGKIAQSVRQSEIHVEDVAGKGLVSTGDIKVNTAIIKAAKVKFPNNILLTEEGSTFPSDDDLITRAVVIADPIDGTRWYKDRGDLWTVTMALAKADVLMTAATLRPDTKELWVAEKGKGTYYRNRQQLWSPIRTLDLKDLSKAKIGIGGNMSTLEGRQEMNKYFLDLIERSRGPYVMASTALELAWIAQGLVLGGEIHPRAKPWDKAAGILLVNEAGGRASGWPHRKNMYGDGLIAAANSAIYESLSQIVIS